MPRDWNKGFTKNTHPSLLKTSETMKVKKLDNFSAWRKKMIKEGKIKNQYNDFKKNGDLAELIGVTLGDGNINVYARTEEVRIFSNSNNDGFITRYSNLVEKIFNKKPYVKKVKHANCVKISLYEKEISKRLGIPSGKRTYLNIEIPDWILAEKKYIIRYLRGLYEAEGCFATHAKTHTYKFIFSNRNESILLNVYKLLVILGFSPHQTKYQIQLSKKEEVCKAVKILKFREYK